MKRDCCPCECQIALEGWGRGLYSLHRSTPHFLPSSFCLYLSLFPFFSVPQSSFFHFLILFQPPLAHCAPCFLSLFFPSPHSFCHLPSVYLFSILAPPSLIFLSSVYFFSILPPPPFLFSICLFLFIYNQSPSCLPCLSFFNVAVLHPGSLVSLPPIFLVLTHSSECDRQVLVTVEASNRTRL